MIPITQTHRLFKPMKCRKHISLAIFFFLSLSACGQTLNGHVYDARSGKNLINASIEMENYNTWTVTDSEGNFSVNIPAGECYLNVRSLGYASQRIRVDGNRSAIEIALEQESLQLNEVVVTASEQKLGSVSQINRAALKHTQPTSLFDALQLVPGQLAQNPDLSSAQQFTIRQATVGSAAQRMNALGTALIMDGTPVSNNANIQVNQNILNSSAGSLPPFSSVAGRGNDLRQIPADHIESIEIIRGVPSVRYGDLTSGAVIVNTFAGVYSPRILARINPTLQQFSAGYGRKVAAHQTLNTDVDLTRAVDDPRDDLNRFTRFNTQLTWEIMKSDRLRTTNRFILNSLVDQTKEDPSAAMSRRSQESRDVTFRWNTNNKFSLNNLLSDQINLIASLSYSWQNSYFQELVTRDIFPVTAAMTEGTAPGEYGRSEYLNQTKVHGRPLTLYTRVESAKSITINSDKHNVLYGIEGRYEQNRGEGRQFDPRTPPRQNYGVGDRPRSYQDIPALQQAGVYLEDKWSRPIAGKTFTVLAGVRWDMLLRKSQNDESNNSQTNIGHSVNPRLNAIYTITESLSLRGGVGMMTKMPTLSYLYPNPVYFDLVNYNYFASSPAERLVVLTTRIIQPGLRQVQPYVSKKWEAGFDLEPSGSGWQVTASFFQEQMDDAIQIVRQIKPLENYTIEAESYPTGAPPILDPVPAAIDTFMAAHDVPVNNLRIRNQGVDFTIQSPRIENINTTFQLTGAVIHSRSEQTDEFLDADRAVFNAQFSGRVPLYAAGQSTESMRFNTSLRLINHIPVFKLIISGLIQTIWIEKNRLQNYGEQAIAYMDKTGEIKPVTTVTDLSGLNRTVHPASLQWQNRPAMWLFNLRITKEWKAGRGFAFYANNLFNTRPLYTDNINGQNFARNQPEFFFGAELSYSF
jgi:TonB dependent receptor/CarboxypepD_reg-like domain/TonB-dependent Receptor Plug Domain